MPSPWKSPKNIPSFSVDTMLLLTDGSVLCHEYESPNWHRLVPPPRERCQRDLAYRNAGSGKRPALAKQSSRCPLYYAAAVL
jgi:hypothetical protein